ncbi:hypothetical protein ABIA45_007405 [Bradyrhizobium sp. USDA 336]
MTASPHTPDHRLESFCLELDDGARGVICEMMTLLRDD